MLLNEFRNHFIDSLIEDYHKTEIIAFFRRLTDFYFQWPPTFCALNTDYTLSQLELDVLSNALEELKVHSPLQYITHEAHFYNRSFYVDQNVLIPRPETEDLVHWVLSDFDHFEGSLDVLEVGTGSGCIAVSLAKNLNHAHVYALDVSHDALEVAKRNATLNNVSVEFIEANILNLETWNTEFKNLKFDIIVSNPPYVRELEKAQMKSNVVNNEPHLALFVENEDPLIFYKAITKYAVDNLTTKGSLFFEINEYLGKPMTQLLKSFNFNGIELKQDIFKKDRMIKGTKKA